MSGSVIIVCINHQVLQWVRSRPVILLFAQVCKAGKAKILNMRVRVSSKVSTPPLYYMIVLASLLNMSLIELRAPAGYCRHRLGEQC